MGIQNNRERIVQYLPDFMQPETRDLIRQVGNQLNEIRLRIGRPAVAMLVSGHRTICVNHPVTTEELAACFEKICEYSVFSHQAELSQGFITLPGGNRVGICGTACLDKAGNRTVRFISSLNIRMAGDFVGCSAQLIPALFADKLCGTLIAGPPCSGKTTLLKDFALKLSSAPFFKKTVIVDERDELSAMHRGVPCHTIGDFCDVLSGYPKAEGILNAVRTLSPDIIVCDEIGGVEEASAVRDVVNAGIVMISSVHACNVDELYKRETVRILLKSGVFEKIVLLKSGSARCVPEGIYEVDVNGL